MVVTGMQQKSRHCSTWTLLGLLLPPKKSVSDIIKGYFGSQLCGKKAFSDGWLSLQPMACWLYGIFSQFSSLWRVPFLLPLGGHVSMDRMARCLLKAVVSVSEGPVCCMGEYTTAYFCVCVYARASLPPSSHETCPTELHGSLSPKTAPLPLLLSLAKPP